MMIDKELLAKHIEYSLWASLKVLGAAEKLPPEAVAQDRGNSFGGILWTLAHIYQADRVWLARFQGDPYFTLAQTGDYFTLESLKQDWPKILNSFAAWVRAQDNAKLEERLFWRNIRGEDKTEVIYKIL